MRRFSSYRLPSNEHEEWPTTALQQLLAVIGADHDQGVFKNAQLRQPPKIPRNLLVKHPHATVVQREERGPFLRREGGDPHGALISIALDGVACPRFELADQSRLLPTSRLLRTTCNRSANEGEMTNFGDGTPISRRLGIVGQGVSSERCQRKNSC